MDLTFDDQRVKDEAGTYHEMKGTNSGLSFGFFDYLFKNVIAPDLKKKDQVKFEDIDILIKAYQQYQTEVQNKIGYMSKENVDKRMANKLH